MRLTGYIPWNGPNKATIKDKHVISSDDRTILRDLARQVADLAALPVQAERRKLWGDHNSLRTTRPMILLFPEGAWEEIMPGGGMTCGQERARGIERHLRMLIYRHEHFADDMVLENEWIVRKVVRSTGWGLSPRHIASPAARGAWHFDPVIKTPADLKKLKVPEISWDEEATERNLADATDLFGDILDVKLTGVARLCYHLMSQYTGLRGLEEVMIDMYAEPQMLHDAMEFLTAGHQSVLQQHIDLNLLSLNNDATYQNSGGNGYTDQLPADGFDPDRVRPCDMWASAEAQEMAQVGPDQHAEFVLQYEKRLLAPWGLNGYGCCEDLTDKMEHVFTIPNIRRISISPWADVDRCAEKLKGDYIFSWKPHPAHLVGEFNEEMIRGYIRHTVEVAVANGCVLEMILKDTHTCEHHPDRFDRWCRIAREEVDLACA